MKNKIKILHLMKKHYFYDKERVSRYYLDLEITYYNKLKFILHNKLILYFFGLISGLSFLFFYYNDIKMFSIIMDIININQINYNILINKDIALYCIYIIDIIIHNKLILGISIILIFFIIFIIKYNIKTATELLSIFIYKRINYILNLCSFLIVFDLDIVSYFEYNFFYLMIVFCFLVKDILKSIFFRKRCFDSSFCHFLSIPYFLIILSFFILLIQSIYFYPIFYYVLILNKRFFIVSYHCNIL